MWVGRVPRYHGPSARRFQPGPSASRPNAYPISPLEGSTSPGAKVALRLGTLFKGLDADILVSWVTVLPEGPSA